MLLTLDLDFSCVHAYPPGENAGIVIFRLSSQDKVSVLSLVSLLIPRFERDSPRGQLWIVDEQKIKDKRVNPFFVSLVFFVIYQSFFLFEAFDA